MKTTILATYKRKSTLWKNANGFYHMQDWTTMECIKVDFSEDIESIKRLGVRFLERQNGIDVDVTEREIEKRYGKTYCIKFINARETNEKCYWFKTADEANNFFKSVMKDKILKNFKKVS